MARAAEAEGALSERKQPEMAAAAGFTAGARVCVCVFSSRDTDKV